MKDWGSRRGCRASIMKGCVRKKGSRMGWVAELSQAENMAFKVAQRKSLGRRDAQALTVQTHMHRVL
jgi:hypothetical protein